MNKEHRKFTFQENEFISLTKESNGKYKLVTNLTDEEMQQLGFNIFRSGVTFSDAELIRQKFDEYLEKHIDYLKYRYI